MSFFTRKWVGSAGKTAKSNYLNWRRWIKKAKRSWEMSNGLMINELDREEKLKDSELR